MKTIALALVLLAADQPVTVRADLTPCQVRPASKEYWSYRLIDGRKCWFKGRSMDKSQLYWSGAIVAERNIIREQVKQTESTIVDERVKQSESTTYRERVTPVERTIAEERDIAIEKTKWQDHFNQAWRDMLSDMAAPWWRNNKPVQEWGLEP